MIRLRKVTGKYTIHYNDVIMGDMASQITSLTSVYSTVYSDVDQRKHQSSASLAFVWGIHRGPVNSPHKCPVTGKMFPFDDAIMYLTVCSEHKRKHQGSRLMTTCERRIYRWLVDCPHKGPVTRKMFPCHYVFMLESIIRLNVALMCALWRSDVARLITVKC